MKMKEKLRYFLALATVLTLVAVLTWTVCMNEPVEAADANIGDVNVNIDDTDIEQMAVKEPGLQVKDLWMQKYVDGGELVSETNPLVLDTEYLVTVSVRRGSIDDIPVDLKIEFSNEVQAGSSGGLIRVTLARDDTDTVSKEAEANLFLTATENLTLEYVPDSLGYAPLSPDEAAVKPGGVVAIRAIGDADVYYEGATVLCLKCDGGEDDGLLPGMWQRLSFRLRTRKMTDWQDKFEVRSSEPPQITALGLIPAGKMAIYAPKIEDLWQLREVQAAGEMYVEPNWSEKALKAEGNLLATELHLTMAVDLPSWVDELRDLARKDAPETPYLTMDLVVGRDGLVRAIAQVATADSSKIFASSVEQSWQVDELKDLPLKTLAATGWTTVAENNNGYTWSSENSYSIMTGVWANVDKMQNLPMLTTPMGDTDAEMAGKLLSTRVDLMEFAGDRIYITYVL